jgi:hypothetical protein
MAPLNAFVTEGNAEIYLSRLYRAVGAVERDNLLRLLVKEQANMGFSRVHLENGERRVIHGRKRLDRQRMIVAGLPSGNREIHRSALLLETLERTQELLEGHLRLLRERQEQTKL